MLQQIASMFICMQDKQIAGLTVWSGMLDVLDQLCLQESTPHGRCCFVVLHICQPMQAVHVQLAF